jgi:ketosteroid isomerase-like protein
MSIEIVRKAYADFSQGNIVGILDALDNNVEWITPGADALAGVRKGKEEVAAFFRLVGEVWQFNSFLPKQFIANGDQVIVLGRYEAKSVATGKTAASDWVMLWEVKNSKVTRFQEFYDTQVVNRALG